jgi:hypothetical protein
MLRPRRGAAEAGQGGGESSVRRRRGRSVLLLALALAVLAVVLVLAQYSRRLGDSERRRIMEEEAAWVSGAAGQLVKEPLQSTESSQH